MGSLPLVSVVIPSYNHAAYVRAAVDSVLTQTLDAIEVLVIDDASSDDTAQVLAAIEDPRLSVRLNTQNAGSAAVINQGIRLARAPYVAILNSDDVFEPERLEVCHRTLRETGALLLGTDLRLIDGSGEVLGDRALTWIDWYRELREIWRDSGDLIGTLIAGNLFCTTSNFFIDKRLFDSVGLLADYRYVQDYEFLLRTLARHPDRVCWLETPLLRYRLHGRNTITEDPLTPASQTLEILARWMPDLAVGERAMARLHRFERHLCKLAKYIESGAAAKVHVAWQADVKRLLEAGEATARRLEGECRAAGAALAETREQLARQEVALTEARAQLARQEAQCQSLGQELNLAQRRCEALLASRGYRLGHGLLAPARWLRRLLR